MRPSPSGILALHKVEDKIVARRLRSLARSLDLPEPFLPMSKADGIPLVVNSKFSRLQTLWMKRRSIMESVPNEGGWAGGAEAADGHQNARRG